MKHITLHGTAREKGRKSSIKSIRREGHVPCVLYGNGIENVLFSVDARELKALTHTPNSYIVDLDIDGKSYLAVMHELQFHPVTDNTIHADFLAISADKPVSIDVPLNIFGNCAGVKAGGKLLIEARKLRVSGLPDQIPDVLDIDITNLRLGKQIVAGDLSFEGVQIVSPKTTGVCTVKHTRAAMAAAEEAEAAEDNMGFSVLDTWAQASNTLFTTVRYGDMAEIRLKGRTFILLKPSTYMNLSGKAVAYWLDKKNIPVENLLVIADDMNLPFGTLRMRKGGSAGGHNGLANIAEMLGTQDYPRLRVGIGSHVGRGPQVDFVLGKWDEEEEKQLPEIRERAVEAVKSFGLAGIERTMSQFNRQ